MQASQSLADSFHWTEKGCPTHLFSYPLELREVPRGVRTVTLVCGGDNEAALILAEHGVVKVLDSLLRAFRKMGFCRHNRSARMCDSSASEQFASDRSIKLVLNFPFQAPSGSAGFVTSHFAVEFTFVSRAAFQSFVLAGNSELLQAAELLELGVLER